MLEMHLKYLNQSNDDIFQNYQKLLPSLMNFLKEQNTSE